MTKCTSPICDDPATGNCEVCDQPVCEGHAPDGICPDCMSNEGTDETPLGEIWADEEMSE